MRKKLGYIPIEPGEDITALSKETDVINIQSQWFKLAEVWVPGVGLGEVKKQELIQGEWKDQPKEEKFKKEFEPLERQRATGKYRVCKNCGKTQDAHVMFKLCP